MWSPTEPTFPPSCWETPVCVSGLAVKVLILQSCPTLCSPVDYSPWDFPESWSGLPLLLQGIFPTQGSNPGILHFRQILYYLSHQGSPVFLQQLVTELFTAGVFLAVLEAEHWALSLLRLLSSYTASVSAPSVHHVTKEFSCVVRSAQWQAASSHCPGMSLSLHPENVLWLFFWLRKCRNI